MARTDRTRLLVLAQRRGVLTAEDVRHAGVHSQQLTRWVAAGVLERVARGQYRLPGRPIPEHHALPVAARAVPRGVICLLSALGVHGIGSQLPAEVWLAIERGAHTPSVPQLPLNDRPIQSFGIRRRH